MAAVSLASLLCIVFIFGFPIWWSVHVSNRMNKLYLKTEQLRSNVVGCLMRRNDILRCFLSIVSSYAEWMPIHDPELCNVTCDMNDTALSEVFFMQDKVFRDVYSFLKVYNRLNEGDNVLVLQKIISDVDNANKECVRAIKAYNAGTAKYNKYISSFPRSVIARIRHMERTDSFLSVENYGSEGVNH